MGAKIAYSFISLLRNNNFMINGGASRQTSPSISIHLTSFLMVHQEKDASGLDLKC